MENQHRQIKGYRELSQTEIDLMNEIKSIGPQVQCLCQKIQSHLDAQKQAAEAAADEDELARLAAANPQLWKDWGQGSVQLALMELTRSIAQPTFF